MSADKPTERRTTDTKTDATQSNSSKSSETAKSADAAKSGSGSAGERSGGGNNARKAPDVQSAAPQTTAQRNAAETHGTKPNETAKVGNTPKIEASPRGDQPGGNNARKAPDVQSATPRTLAERNGAKTGTGTGTETPGSTKATDARLASGDAQAPPTTRTTASSHGVEVVGPRPAQNPAREGSSPTNQPTNDRQTSQVRPEATKPPSGDHAPTQHQSQERPLARPDAPTHRDASRERTPTGSEKLESVWNRSEPTASGRAFVSPNDTFVGAARNIAPTDGMYTVAIHGNPQGMAVKSVGEGYTRVSASELATLIKSDPNWNSQPVRLFSCETGKTPAHGGVTQAQQVADQLRVPVQAPNQIAWAFPTGPPDAGYASTAVKKLDPMTGREQLFPKTTKDKADGQFVTFYPR